MSACIFQCDRRSALVLAHDIQSACSFFHYDLSYIRCFYGGNYNITIYLNVFLRVFIRHFYAQNMTTIFLFKVVHYISPFMLKVRLTFQQLFDLRSTIDVKNKVSQFN